MAKFELYIDGKDRLTLEIFLKEDSEFSMSRVQGSKCYGLITEICSQKILAVKENRNGEDLSVYYENFVLNISEVGETLNKRGAVRLKNNIVKYLQARKRKELEKEKANSNNNQKSPLKVTRKNKHTGKIIIATGITLLTLIGAMLLYEQSKDDVFIPTESTSYSQQTQENLIDSSFDVEDSIFIDNGELDIFIPFEDRSTTEKAKITKAYYGSTIEKYSKMYGLDPRIVLAIATQERGIHAEKMDPGGATGLMQIQNAVWVGKELTAYNYDSSKYEKIIVNKEDLSDVFKNIKYGCMIFQNCLIEMHNNVLAAIQCYNMGYSNMMKILESYSLETGKDKIQILEDISDCGWLEHRDIIRVGDQKYLENVFSWMGSEINIDSFDNRGNTIKINIINKERTKNMSFN